MKFIKLAEISFDKISYEMITSVTSVSSIYGCYPFHLESTAYLGDTRLEFRIVGGASKISVCFSGNISVSHN